MMQMREIGDYKLGFKLGSGKNAECLLGIKKDGRYCVKVMQLRKADHKKRQMIENEIRILQLLKGYPNILLLEESLQSESSELLRVAVVTELLKLDLERYLRLKKRLSENSARAILKQLLTALHCCHSNMVTHHDIKLENVGIDPETLQVKLLDFGMATISRTEKEMQGQEVFCGTPFYVPPEKCAQRKYDGRKSDVWSCGVLLYKLLTGKFPFDSEDGNVMNLMYAVCHQQFEMPPCSAPLASFLGGILCKQPAQRFSAQSALEHEWFQRKPESAVLPKRKMRSAASIFEKYTHLVL